METQTKGSALLTCSSASRVRDPSALVVSGFFGLTFFLNMVASFSDR